MIQVISHDENFYSVNFSGENFLEAKNICKNNGLKYDPKSYSWTCNKLPIHRIIKSLEELEMIKYEPSRSVVLERSTIKKEIKLQNIRYNKSFLKKPPLDTYQEEGIRKLIRFNRQLLADDVGLGKTYQMISALNHFIAHKLIDKIFIVSFRATLYNWKRELLMFSNYFKENEIIILDKDNRDFFNSMFVNDYKVVITDYITFRLISDFHYKDITKSKSVKNYRKSHIPLDKWTTESNRCIILDEVQAIKGKSQVSKKLKMIKHYFEYRYGLSATPAPNMLPAKDIEENNHKVTNIFEMFSIFQFLDPNIIPETDQSLLKNYANVGNRFSAYAINHLYYEKANELLDSLKYYIVRRFKKEVLKNLPEQNIKNIFVKMNSIHEKLYQNITYSCLKKMYGEDKSITMKRMMKRFVQLNLSCSDPSIVKIDDEVMLPETKELLLKWKFKYNSKLPICENIVNRVIKEDKEKCIIWSYHPATMNLLAEYFKEFNPVVHHGGCKIPKDISRSEYVDSIIQKFKNDKNCKLAIISPLCLGVGVNMEFCRYAIFFDRIYDAKSYIQALGRIQRATSTKESFVYTLILDDTIDVTLDNILTKKQELHFGLVNDRLLTKEELKSLLTGKII